MNKGENYPNFGKIHTPETLAKISLANSKKVYVYTKDPVSNQITIVSELCYNARGVPPPFQSKYIRYYLLLTQKSNS
jgi:hypothetical protein